MIQHGRILFLFANFIGLFCLNACQFNTSSSSTEVEVDDIIFGYVDKNCWITDRKISDQNTSIHIYNLATRNTVSSTATAMLKNAQNCGEFHTKLARVSNSDAQFYRIDQEFNFGIAWSSHDGLTLDEYDFSSCTTSEGLRYRVTHRQTKNIIWEGYQALGYDSESNCSN